VARNDSGKNKEAKKKTPPWIWQPLAGRDAATFLPDPSSKPPPLHPKSGLATAWILLLLIVVFAAGLCLPPGWNLVVIVAALSLVLVVLGRAIVDEPLGVLINEQNVMSLSPVPDGGLDDRP